VIEEARLKDTPAGLEPAGGGWFVVNVRDTAWITHDAFGAGCVFESREAAPFPELGINIGVLQPGQPVCLYHGRTRRRTSSSSPGRRCCS